MAYRIQYFLLSSFLLSISLVFSPTAFGEEEQSDGPEQIFEPSLERREIKTNAIDTEDFEVGVYFGTISIEDFGSASVTGARVAYHITEDFFFEAAAGLSKAGETSFENLAGNIELLTDEEREFTYYNLMLGYKLFTGEAFIRNRAFSNSFYLTAGAGGYDFADDLHTGIAFGVGYQLLFNDWLTWRIDFRDQVFDLDILGEDKTTHNLELTTGFTIFF